MMFHLSGASDFFGPQELKLAQGSYDALLKNKVSGFYDLTHRLDLWKSSSARATEVRRQADVMVVVGIGGSSLGARAIDQALGELGDRKLCFLDNVDGWELKQFLRQLSDLTRVHWVFVSKSGGTLETLALVGYIHQFYKEKKVSLVSQSTVISENKSSVLMDWAKKNSVPSLEIPLDVGGRFSVLTPVGMLPAAFLGLDIEKIRLGAEEALKDRKSLEQLTAFSLKTFAEQMWITGFWFYSSRLYQLGRWVQQLWAESLAKDKDRQGLEARQASVPLPLLGSTDQHSVLQQLAEGKEKKSIWFVRVTEGEDAGEVLQENLFGSSLSALEGKPIGALLGAFAQSTREALSQVGVASVELTVPRLDEREVGCLFMTMMMVTGMLGECMNINAFDQPGVELGKKLVKNYL